MPRFKTAVTLLGVLLIILLGGAYFFPSVFFANTFSHSNFTIHSNGVEAETLIPILDSAIALLKQSELYTEEVTHEVFLCDGYGLFTFYALTAKNAFAVNQNNLGRIFISKSNAAANQVIRNGERYNTRKLSDIIAHECTHSLIRNELGWMKHMLLPMAKEEGYCETIAQSSSMPWDEGLAHICQRDNADLGYSMTYFIARLYVAHVVNERGLSFTELLDRSEDLDQWEEKVRQWYCPR